MYGTFLFLGHWIGVGEGVLFTLYYAFSLISRSILINCNKGLQALLSSDAVNTLKKFFEK